MNHKLALKLPLEVTTLTKEDILAVVRYLIDLRNGVHTWDVEDDKGRAFKLAREFDHELRCEVVSSECMALLDEHLPNLVNQLGISAVLGAHTGKKS